MKAELMSKALDAIHAEAGKLLKYDLPDEVRRGVDVIISLAEQKQDVRTHLELEELEDRDL